MRWIWTFDCKNFAILPNFTTSRKSLRHKRELALSQREETLNSSPLVALKEACRKQIESSEKYRVSVLRKVAAFGEWSEVWSGGLISSPSSLLFVIHSLAKLTDHYLLSAAQNMEESIVPAGTVLIKQDDVGDSVCLCFVPPPLPKLNDDSLVLCRGRRSSERHCKFILLPPRRLLSIFSFVLFAQRKVNVNDPNEQSIQLAILGSNTYFGEIALLTQEPRTATVTVVSPTAKILMMTKVSGTLPSFCAPSFPPSSLPPSS